eukprot:jgi/Bigna1/66567/fgenesh1_pg.1_\
MTSRKSGRKNAHFEKEKRMGKNWYVEVEEENDVPVVAAPPLLASDRIAARRTRAHPLLSSALRGGGKSRMSSQPRPPSVPRPQSQGSLPRPALRAQTSLQSPGDTEEQRPQPPPGVPPSNQLLQAPPYHPNYRSSPNGMSGHVEMLPMGETVVVSAAQSSDHALAQHLAAEELNRHRRGTSRHRQSNYSRDHRATSRSRSRTGRGKTGERKEDQEWVNEDEVAEAAPKTPFMTYTFSFVQVLIVLLQILGTPWLPGGLAKWGLGITETRETVRLFDGSEATLTIQNSANPFYGPDVSDIIKWGAKYAPCMRSSIATDTYESIAAGESRAGCCILNGQCGVLNQTDCNSFNGMFQGEGSRCNGSCTLTLRPCCYGATYQCLVQTQSYCNALDGVYHDDDSSTQTCGDVNCLNDICGLGADAEPGLETVLEEYIVIAVASGC